MVSGLEVFSMARQKKWLYDPSEANLPEGVMEEGLMEAGVVNEERKVMPVVEVFWDFGATCPDASEEC